MTQQVLPGASEESKWTRWDCQSAIRERLALFVVYGRALNPAEWGYHPAGDFWYYCGPDETMKRTRHRVMGEASYTRVIAAAKWNLTEDDVLALCM